VHALDDLGPHERAARDDAKHLHQLAKLPRGELARRHLGGAKVAEQADAHLGVGRDELRQARAGACKVAHRVLEPGQDLGGPVEQLLRQRRVPRAQAVELHVEPPCF